MQKGLAKRALSRSVLPLVIVLALPLGRGLAQGAHHHPVRHNVWYSCLYHAQWAHPRYIQSFRCWTIPLRKPHPTRFLHWRRTVWKVSPHVTRSTRFPVFLDPPPVVKKTEPVSSVQASSIAGHTTVHLTVTAYSWGCGTPNPTMSSGLVPYVGAVANDWLPFNTRIYVPDFGYSGVVLDRGVGTGGFDLFEPTCAMADQIGRASHDVIIY